MFFAERRSIAAGVDPPALASILHLSAAALLLAAGGATGAMRLRARLRGAEPRPAAARLDRFVATPAAVLMALSAAMLVRATGWAQADGWAKLSLILSSLAALCWLAGGAMHRRAAAARADPALSRHLFALAFLYAWPALPLAATVLALGLAL